MSHNTAEWLVAIVTGYLAFGVVFAAAFVTRGINRIDPLAPAAPWTFRALVVPGTALFWPLLLVRWLSGSVAPPVESNPHRPELIRLAGTSVELGGELLIRGDEEVLVLESR